MGLELPADFIAYLQTFNGQRHANFSHGFYGLAALLPVAEIIDTNRNRRRLFGREPVATGFRENKIRGQLWSPGWLAFASFQDTELLVLDMNPGINGTWGQVFVWYPAVDLAAAATVLALSFAEFGQILLQRLQSPALTIDELGALWCDDDWF